MTSFRAAALAASASCILMAQSAPPPAVNEGNPILCNTREQVIELVAYIDVGFSELEAADLVNENSGNGVCAELSVTFEFVAVEETIETNHQGLVDIWHVRVTTLDMAPDNMPNIVFTVPITEESILYNQYTATRDLVPPPPPDELYMPEPEVDEEEA